MAWLAARSCAQDVVASGCRRGILVLLFAGVATAQVPASLEASLPTPVRASVASAVDGWTASAEARLEAARLASELAPRASASTWLPRVTIDASLLPRDGAGGRLSASWAWTVLDPASPREDAERWSAVLRSEMQRRLTLETVALDVMRAWLSLWRYERQLGILDALAARPVPGGEPGATRHATLFEVRDVIALDADLLAGRLAERHGVPAAGRLGPTAWHDVLAAAPGAFCAEGNVNVVLASVAVETAVRVTDGVARSSQVPTVRAGVDASLAMAASGLPESRQALAWWTVGAPADWPVAGTARLDVSRDAVSVSLTFVPDAVPHGDVADASIAAERERHAEALFDARVAARRDAFEAQRLAATRGWDARVVWDGAMVGGVMDVVSADVALRAVDRIARAVELELERVFACARVPGFGDGP